MTNAIASRCLANVLYIPQASPRTPDSGFMAAMLQRNKSLLGDGPGPIFAPAAQYLPRLTTEFTTSPAPQAPRWAIAPPAWARVLWRSSGVNDAAKADRVLADL